MAVTIDLISSVDGEIKNFLTSFYESSVSVDDDVCEWMYTYTSPLDAVDVISAIYDNYENHSIEAWVSIDSGFFVKITKDNGNDLIRYMFQRFYTPEELII